MGSVVSACKKAVNAVGGFVRKVCTTVKKVVKKVGKKIVRFAKKCYNKFIKPWAQPIIDCAKKFIPVVDLAYRGFQALKNGIKTVKNIYKTARNYFTGKPYKKYWNKTKQYTKKIFVNVGKFIGNSTVFGKIYNIGKKIYYTGKHIYSQTKNTIDFVKNSYGYIKNKINGKDSTYYSNQLKKNWKKSFLSRFNYKKIINEKSFDKLNNNYKRIKEYYNIFERYKNIIKSNIFMFNNMRKKFQNLLEDLRNKIEQKKEYIKKAKENQNYTYEITVQRCRYISLPHYINFCINCKVYCCSICEWPENVPYCTCVYFNGGRKCPKCPGNCPRECHIRIDKKEEKYYEKEKIIHQCKYDEYNKYINKIQNCENDFTLKIKEIDSLKHSIQNKEKEVKNIISEFKKNIFPYRNNFNSSEYEIINLVKKLNIEDLINDFERLNKNFFDVKVN